MTSKLDLLRAARIVTPDGIASGIVAIDGTEIRDVRRCAVASEEVDVDFATGWLLPAFVDVHCHGGGGTSFSSTDPDELRSAAEFHRRHGTAAMLASLVSDDIAALCAQAEVIAQVVERADTPIVGLHAEGPFLSARRRGAQNPCKLLRPDVGAFRDLWEASRGTLKMLTLAPELPGAEAIIKTAIDMGVAVAIGHTDASYEEAAAAFRRGATVATHLFNGMPPLHHREPGAVAAALDMAEAVEVIADGHHVHPAAVRLVGNHAPDRLVLVTDAIAAAGMGDGRYRLGGLDVTVADGQAQLSDGSSLAGSTLTMDAALRYAVLTAGLPVTVASRASSATPARILGIAGSFGAIAPGRRADVVHVNDDLLVDAVMIAGQWQARD